MAISNWGASNKFRSSAVVSGPPATFAAWGYMTSGSGTMMIACNTGNTDNDNVLKASINASARVEAGSGSGFATSTTTRPTSTWFHAGFVFASNSSRSAYLNGSNKGTNGTAGSSSGINRFTLGCRDNIKNDEGFNGIMADVGVWNIALSDEDMAILAKGISPLLVKPQNLVGFIPLVRELVDLRGNPFSLIGSLTASDHPRIYGVN